MIWMDLALEIKMKPQNYCCLAYQFIIRKQKQVTSMLRFLTTIKIKYLLQFQTGEGNMGGFLLYVYSVTVPDDLKVDQTKCIVCWPDLRLSI